MASLAAPLKISKLTLFLLNWPETGQLPEQSGNVIFFPFVYGIFALILLILSSIIDVVLGFLGGLRCSGKILYAS
jgi:hypothetical protein